MSDSSLYILQVNAGLLLFWLLYKILFARDTFLKIRRFFLLTIILLSFLYPLISLSGWLEKKEPLQNAIVSYIEYFPTITVIAEEATTKIPLTTADILLRLWLVGTLLLLLWLLIRLTGIFRLVLRGKKEVWYETKVWVLGAPTAPFSFLGWIFVNPSEHDEKELQEIITHEKAHVKQHHSLDMLISEFLCATFWFNPAVWLVRYEIRQNLEFLADKDVVSSGYDRKNYQYHLLRLSHLSTMGSIVNNFNVSQLKKRIMMMNKKRTSRLGLIKYALLLPVTGLLVLSANASVVGEIAREMVFPQMAEVDAAVSVENLSTPPRISSTETARPSKTVVAQNKNIIVKGRVLDEGNKPLAGVTVMILGTTSGSSTNDKGEFSIEMPEDAILCFSHVGKAAQKWVLKKADKKIVEIKMQPAPAMLEGIHVVGYATNNKPKQLEAGDKEEFFTVVEQMPVFPGENIQRFLAKNVRYPSIAIEQSIEGTVYVSFIVDKTGKVTQPKIVKSVDSSLDKEAIRVINLMPAWKPGKQRGKNVDVLYTIPIIFELEKEKTDSKTDNSSTSSGIIQSEKASGSSVSSQKSKDTLYRVAGEENKIQLREKFDGVYIVDGQVMPNDFVITTISTENIESISVIKSNAANIYGPRGEEGAIIITTKKKKE